MGFEYGQDIRLGSTPAGEVASEGVRDDLRTEAPADRSRTSASGSRRTDDREGRRAQDLGIGAARFRRDRDPQAGPPPDEVRGRAGKPRRPGRGSAGGSAAEGEEGEDERGRSTGDRGPCGRSRGWRRRFEARPGRRPSLAPALHPRKPGRSPAGVVGGRRSAEAGSSAGPGPRRNRRRRPSGTGRGAVEAPTSGSARRSTDASSASEAMSQSVMTRRLTVGHGPRFSNVVIRGSLACGRRDRLPDRIALAISPAGRMKTADSHAILVRCASDPQIPDKQHTTSRVV